MSTIELERYISAFETWAQVTDQGSTMRESIAQVSAYLRTHYQGEVAIETLCKRGMEWLRGQKLAIPDVGKSCLMGRMTRTRSCVMR